MNVIIHASITVHEAKMCLIIDGMSNSMEHSIKIIISALFSLFSFTSIPPGTLTVKQSYLISGWGALNEFHVSLNNMYSKKEKKDTKKFKL